MKTSTQRIIILPVKKVFGVFISRSLALSSRSFAMLLKSFIYFNFGNNFWPEAVNFCMYTFIHDIENHCLFSNSQIRLIISVII